MKFYTNGSYGETYQNDISINYPSTDHDYHAYNGQTYTTDLGRTVYGGTLDVVSGSGKETLRKFVLDGTIADADFGLTVNQTYTRMNYAPFASVGIKGATFISNIFAFVSDQSEIGVNKIWGNGSAPRMFLGLPTTVTTKAEARQWFADNPTEVVYPLAEPLTYQLTPTEVALLKGQNNVWTDSGEVEVTYKADVGLYIDKKLNG